MTDEMDEIWALYADDGGQALDTAEEAMAQIASGPGTERSEGIAALFRAVHTVKGNSRVLGLRVAESRAHLTEDLIGLVRDQGAPWDAEVESILLLALDRLRTILDATAATRQDVEEETGADLMARLEDKIARIHAALGAQNSKEPTAPPPLAGQEQECAEEPNDAPPESDADPLAPLGETVETTSLDPPTAPVERADTPTEGESVLHNVLPLLSQVATGGAPRVDALLQISALAGQAGFARLAALAEALAAGPDIADEREDVRIYEELHAIELSMAPLDMPSPRPRDLLSGWCAEHVFGLIDDLRASIGRLAEGAPMDPTLREIEPALRRIQMACDHYGLTAAARLSMALLDLVARMPFAVPATLADGTAASDETVLRMLETFLSTVELALDSARAGEPPDQQPFDKLAGESGRIDFRRSGGPTAPEALEALHLPPQFLRVMSPRSVRIAQDSARTGLHFRIVRARFAEDTEAAERFFDIMADGAIRQITSVSVLSERDVCFDFLLATSLDDEAFAARLEQADPNGKKLEALSASVGHTSHPDDRHRTESRGEASGVSLEFMEIVSEVASGLASVGRDLRLGVEIDLHDGLARVLSRNMTSEEAMRQSAALDRLLGYIDAALLNVDHLARRVAALQEEAMKSRLRPADHALRPVLDDLRTRLAQMGVGGQITAVIDPVPMDRQALEVLESGLDRHMSQRMACVAEKSAGEGPVWKIHFRRRDDRVLLTVDDPLAAPPEPDLIQAIASDAAAAGGRCFVQAREVGGWQMLLSLPIRMLAMEGMVVASSGVHYVFPIEAVISVLSAGPERIIRRAAAGGERFLVLPGGTALPIVALEGGQPDGGGLFVVIEAEGQRRAVLVDALLGQEVVRLRPLQGVLARLDRLAGLAILAGGEVALVLSPLSLCQDGAVQAIPA